ncbi:hypothetical protein DM02DRAFT_619792 [Periconia macrospinosa]|uniref:Uncharacterized protein n=1 Tax=Periconia macrospinosa TaxID=97972 RepID=A0A2V1D3N7_9PLEO|nr:hypothetical protein DM02DRAFT_619792 [Periconia macrospinosa]
MHNTPKPIKQPPSKTTHPHPSPNVTHITQTAPRTVPAPPSHKKVIFFSKPTNHITHTPKNRGGKGDRLAPLPPTHLPTYPRPEKNSGT